MLAPLLFADEQPQQQGSPVAPARRSASAPAKARTKRTPEGLAVQSFHELLKDLATIVKNRIRPVLKATAPFDIMTRPTPLQKYALQLLGLAL